MFYQFIPFCEKYIFSFLPIVLRHVSQKNCEAIICESFKDGLKISTPLAFEQNDRGNRSIKRQGKL